MSKLEVAFHIIYHNVPENFIGHDVRETVLMCSIILIIFEMAVRVII